MMINKTFSINEGSEVLSINSWDLVFFMINQKKNYLKIFVCNYSTNIYRNQETLLKQQHIKPLD
jgi:hypothetical protein